MFYEPVLKYVMKLLKNHHIPVHIIEEPFLQIEDSIFLDFGLRETIFAEINKNEAFHSFIKHIKENILYYVTDNYYCSYACMKLPNPDKVQYFIVGPFTYINMNSENYFQLFEKLNLSKNLYPILITYYNNITFIDSETFLKNLLNTFAETIWKSSFNYKIEYIQGNLVNMFFTENSVHELSKQLTTIPVNIQAAEIRLEYEKQIVQIVSQGNYSMVEQLLLLRNNAKNNFRLSNELRDYKNTLIAFNTLLRLSAEIGEVHPARVDELFHKYLLKIESLTFCPDFSLEKEMLYKYCLMVHNYSTKGYSAIIQKVINQITFNLTGNLSLNTLADLFNISAGYLSTLFKKETGQTLTDFVNTKRIESAIFLLNTTDLQIQEIAPLCGISDINYFTRVFKKIKGITPKKYRNSILKFS